MEPQPDQHGRNGHADKGVGGSICETTDSCTEAEPANRKRGPEMYTCVLIVIHHFLLNNILPEHVRRHYHPYKIPLRG